MAFFDEVTKIIVTDGYGDELRHGSSFSGASGNYLYLKVQSTSSDIQSYASGAYLSGIWGHFGTPVVGEDESPFYKNFRFDVGTLYDRHLTLLDDGVTYEASLSPSFLSSTYYRWNGSSSSSVLLVSTSDVYPGNALGFLALSDDSTSINGSNTYQATTSTDYIFPRPSFDSQTLNDASDEITVTSSIHDSYLGTWATTEDVIISQGILTDYYDDTYTLPPVVSHRVAGASVVGTTVHTLQFGDALTNFPDESEFTIIYGDYLDPIRIASPRGNVLATIAASEVSESGSQTTISVSLDLAPRGSVNVNLSTAFSDEIDVPDEPLTFTPDNYNIPQIVTITGLADSSVDGLVQSTVQAIAGPNRGSGWSGASVTIYNMDVPPATAPGVVKFWKFTNSQEVGVPMGKYWVIVDKSSDSLRWKNPGWVSSEGTFQLPEYVMEGSIIVAPTTSPTESYIIYFELDNTN